MKDDQNGTIYKRNKLEMTQDQLLAEGDTGIRVWKARRAHTKHVRVSAPQPGDGTPLRAARAEKVRWTTACAVQGPGGKSQTQAPQRRTAWVVLVKHREQVLCPASPAPLPVPLKWPATSRDHGCERLVWLVAGLAPKSYSEKYASRPPSTALPLSRQVAPRGARLEVAL